MSETEKMLSCVCGKHRGKLNNTNWKRHLDNCKARKTITNSRSIISFFPGPKKVRVDTETSYFCSHGKCHTKLNNF
jgi:hypothetical protein